MSDLREDILARLLAVIDVEGIRKAVRNTEEINERMRPAAILFDGSEEASEDDPRRRPAGAPRIITMTPQVLVLLGADPADVGTNINLLRARLVKAISTDATLAGITLNDQGIRYLGCETNLESGRTTEAEMSLFFAFTYVMRPALLVEDVTA